MKIWSHENFTIHEFDELESTNDKAFELVEAKEIFDHGVVLAHSQTKGRGRQNRNWSSPNGNLYFSLVLQNKAGSATIPQISFVAAVALRDVMEKIFASSSHANIHLKWPNDVLIDSRKVAGLLLENKIITKNLSLIVLGIGVNIESSPFDTIFPAGNLLDFSVKITPTELLKTFLQQFEISYKNWNDFGFANTRNSWLRSAYNFKKKIAIRYDSFSQFMEGVFVDLDVDGNLLFEQDGILHKITAGEIS